MDWADYYTSLTSMLQVEDPYGMENFNEILKRLIDEVELFLWAHPKLDFLVTRTVDRSQMTTSGLRRVPIPRSLVVVEDVALITPTGVQMGQPGAKRLSLQRTSLNFINMTWPDESQVQTPKKYETYWSIFSQHQQVSQAGPPPAPVAGNITQDSPIIIGPTVDAQYVVEFRGTYRPPSFYVVAGFDYTANDASTQYATTPGATTFLTWWHPDLYLAASMVFGAGYQKNFGAQADDPRSAVSWMSTLERLLGTASSEEFRKKAMGWSWSARPMPEAAASAMPAAPPQPAQ